ncbi:MAG: methyltransferase domain-containing protein [Mariprofundales bacterium]
MASLLHPPVNKVRWVESQLAERKFWEQKIIMERATKAVKETSGFVPLMRRYTESFDEQSRILDVGCGPLCLARYIKKGTKIYLDPLLDDYRRAYPNMLPASDPEGMHSTQAENIPEPDASIDVVVCTHALDHMHNPELALNEMRRVMKTDGILLLSIRTWPVWLTILHLICEKYIPLLRQPARPYRYAYRGIKVTLLRHVDIIQERTLSPRSLGNSIFSSENRMFVCRHKNH